MATDPAAATRRGPGSKYRFLITPKWIAFHLLVVVVVVAMVNLAFWQLRRLDERRDFNAQVRANANQPIAPFDDVAMATRRSHRRSSGGESGHRHLRRRTTSSSSSTDRRTATPAATSSTRCSSTTARCCWSTAASWPCRRRSPAPRARSTLVGRLRVSERRATGQPADEAADALTEIRRIDIDVLAEQFDATVLPMYIEQLESTPPDAAVLQPIVAPALDEGPHLSYTIQWFIFSVCVIVGWVLAVRRSIAVSLRQGCEETTSSLHPDRRRGPADLIVAGWATARTAADCRSSNGHPPELLDDVRASVYAGSRWRYTVSTLTAMRPNSPSAPKSGLALISAAISRAASHASTPDACSRPAASSTNDEVVAHRRHAGLVGDRTVARARRSRRPSPASGRTPRPSCSAGRPTRSACRR